MPVRLNFIDRLAFYRLNRAPAPLLDLFGAAGFRAASLAIEMGIFDAIAAGEQTPADIATAVDADPDGVGHLLDFLVALGYLDDSDETYELTATTLQWLQGEESNLAPWFTYWNDLAFQYWTETLAETVRDGEPSETMYEWLDGPDEWEVTQRGFRAAGTLLVDDVLDAITVRDTDRDLLDVGGGHGLYAIEACRRNPNLDATIVDYPDALTVAREEITAAGLDERIDCEGVDVMTEYFGENYDLAFLFNVAHGFEPGENRMLLERIYEALAPGGRVVVLDQFEGSAPTPASTVAIAFARFIYFSTLGADVYAIEEVSDWLRTAGFENVEQTTFRTLPGIGLLEAEKVREPAESQ